MGNKLKIYKKKAIPSSPTTADDGIYYVKTSQGFKTVIISSGKIFEKKESYIYDISNTEYTKLCSVSVKQNGGEVSLYLLLNQLQESKADNIISFAYLQSKLVNNIPVFEGIQEYKIGDVKYKIYSKLANGNTSNYSFQRIKQDNGTGFNLILRTKELAISAPASGYRKYSHTVENNVKTDTENRYYTASMLIMPNDLDNQNTKFFDTIIIGNNWTNRIGWANFNKIKNEDGSVFIYQTFLVNRSDGREFTEFSFICENGSTKNATKINNIKVEEGKIYTPYVKAFSELPANSNGVESLIKGLPGLFSIMTGNTYVHIAYADTVEGGGFSENPTNKNYIGIYVDDAQENSKEPSLYKWSLISDIISESEDVINIPCMEVEGKIPYFHIAYADDASGTNFSGIPEKPYIAYLLDSNLTNLEYTIYIKSEEANQKIQINILALNEKEAEVVFYEESHHINLENANEIKTLSGTIPSLQQVMDKGSVTDKDITAPSISSDKEDPFNYSLGKYGLTVKSDYVNSNYGTAGIRIDPVNGGYIIITGNAPKGIKMFFPNENNGGSMELNNGFINFSGNGSSSQLSNSEFIFRNDALKLSEIGVSMSNDMKKSFQEVLGLSDTGWIDVELSGEFEGFAGPPQYRKKNGVVYLQGSIKGGTSQANNSNYLLFTLPKEFAPKRRLFLPSLRSGLGIGRLDIDNQGNVFGTTYSSVWTSFDGLSFCVD